MLIPKLAFPKWRLDRVSRLLFVVLLILDKKTHEILQPK